MDSTPTPSPIAVLFARGVISRLATWDALRIAVQEAWGGPDSAAKRTWFASIIVDSFEEQDPIPDEQYIKEMLIQVMSDEYDAEIDDGSATIVARDIIRLWEETQLGKSDLVVKFEDLADKVKGKRVAAQVEDASNAEGDSEDEDGDDDGDEDGDVSMDESPPQLIDRSRSDREPVVDEDGFTLVKGKGKK